MHEQDNLARASQVRAVSPAAVRGYSAMNTVRALELLAFRALSSPELAGCLQVSTRTARRLLQRLALEGFVTQEGGHRRRYHATLRLAALGRHTLEHAPITHAARPRLAQLAHDTGGVAHLWIAGYDQQLLCAVHADPGTEDPAGLGPWHLAAARSSAAGIVLLADRADLRSCCYLHVTSEPMFAAAVLDHGRVVAAVGLTGDAALQASSAVVAAATRLSTELSSGP
jgi:hypothetical protein